MDRKTYIFRWIVLLGAMCAAPLGVCAADYTYQTLTNLAPCTSSRVLLMNNDTDVACPIGWYTNGVCISGQGYYNTNAATTVVGGTYWWHDGVARPSGTAAIQMNLLAGATHILYQKTEGGEPLALWTLVECRAGSGAYKQANRCYLPWSSTCVPIGPTSKTMPITDLKQAAHISMRSTEDACIYSPFYEDGIGEIYFDVVNGWDACPDSLCVEIATAVKEGAGSDSFADGLDFEKYDWRMVPCDMFVVEDKSTIYLPEEREGIQTLTLGTTKYADSMYFRVRVRPENPRTPMRFRIRRLEATVSTLDTGGLIFIDNIIASYPGVSAVISSSGVETKAPVDTDNRKNCKRANLGYVGAFSEPVLSKGLETACPRMSFSAITNGQPSFVDVNASVSKAECIYRWRYLDQAVGPWKTNLEENVSIIGGTNVVWNVPIEIPDEIGDIEYSYGAWVSGTRYRYFDFANDTKLDFPDDVSTEMYVQCATNFFSRVRSAVSPWQELHVISEVITNGSTLASVTNDWTMDLISSNTWRGFVDTRPSYSNLNAYVRIKGINRWESGGYAPSLESFIWYMPEITAIPDGYKALTVEPEEGKENFITLDCSTGYLVIDFNDKDGTFTINRAEYQDFNMWTPPAGDENKYVGDYVNTTYVGRAKQSYILNASGWDLSRSTSAWWWENFDSMAGNAGFPFDVPFGQNQITPNGWVADNGMYVNGFFTAQTNKTDRGMSLQMQGRGAGSVALVDPADRPNGIGTIAFNARLAQYLEFGDFFCYLGGFTDKNYAFSAKVAMTHTPQHSSHLERNDVSTGKPSVSLVACYRPGSGCYEVRMTRVWASSRTALWGTGDGVMELAIYRWNLKKDGDGNKYWTTKKLASKRLGTNTTYVPSAGGGRDYNKGNYLVPVANTTTVDNDTWTSLFIAVFDTGNGIYVEGAVSEDQVASYSGLSGDSLLQQAVEKDVGTANRMFNIAFTDREVETNIVNGVEKYTKLYHEKGTYGVCSTECPAAFGALNRHALNETGPYYATPSKFTTHELQRDSLNDGDWGSTSPCRMMTWTDYQDEYPERDSYNGVWSFGVCAAPVSQRLKLQTAPYGESSKWADTGLSLLLSSYQPTNLVFSPHTLETVNVKLSVGGTQDDARTDVVIDDLTVSQWKAEDSENSISQTDDWAYTGGWITSSTNNVTDGSGASTDDPIASITKCGFLKYEVEGTPNEYVYVFTNTTAGALGGYAQFIPNCDLTVVGVFGIGGGGGGGAGGGGGGGGGAFQITNAANYTIGEELRVYVGLGGNSSGWNASASGGTPRAVNGSTYGTSAAGGNSYFYGRTVGSATQSARTTYYGYGGGRGGNWRDTVLNSSGVPTTTYAQGQNGQSNRGGGGGSARPRAYPTNTTFTVDTDKLVTVNSRNQGCGVGAGATNVTEAAGGGGGGGLVTYTSATVNFSNTNNVTYAGKNGAHGVAGSQAGNGGRGFPISAIGDEAIRKAIMKLTGLSESEGLGGGGGGGAGTNATTNVGKQGVGSISAGKGLDGGSDGAVSAATYTASFGAADADRFRGGGGGGGAIHAVLNSGGAQANNWLTRGGRGGDGIVVLHVRVSDRTVLLQPMRGETNMPMSVRTPLMSGMSLLALSWKWADSNALLRVQIMTNDVNEANIATRTELLSDGWEDKGLIDFASMSAEDRKAGTTNILIGLRAPITGIARVLVDTNRVIYARNNAMNSAVSDMYGGVAITSFVAFDNPEIDERSWWGWNIMPTDAREYGSLYDHLYDASIDPVRGRTCALNFSGQPGTGDDDPMFADETNVHNYTNHDPFVQTPLFTNGIGQVSFYARMLETNGVNGWVTISGSTDPNEENDDNWTVLENIEIPATNMFQHYVWRMTNEISDQIAVRLTAYAAKNGRAAAGKKYPDGTKIQRVLLEDVTVMQPMQPGLAFAYPPRPYRYNGTKKGSPAALPQEQVLSPDEQPVLNESFGMQVQLVPAGLEDELDRSSIHVFMDWYADESPWGYVNWADPDKRTENTQSGFGIELVPAEGWSENNLIYHSSHTDSSGLIPPQFAPDIGYRVVQYRIYATYKDKNGNPHARVMEVGSDWTEPPWYVFAAGNPYNQGIAKCAYTILDEISPKRAWINEINMYKKDDLSDSTHQYVEVAVPQGLSLKGWTMSYFEYGDTGASGKYNVHTLASFGAEAVEKKTDPSVNQYAFIAIQSPATKAAGTYNTAEHNYLDDGTWGSTLFNGAGVLNVRKPYAFRLLRPTGIVEHELVFMCTNTSTSRVRYQYDGTNFLAEIKKALNDEAWIYAGADNNVTAAEDYSLGVFTNHGESVSCWTNWMKQTPGNVNKLADGTLQYIDPNYFDPPEGDHLWIYAEVDAASKNTVWVKNGEARVNSLVLIVPQGSTGAYSTNVTYEVLKWFDLKSVTTNLQGTAAVEVSNEYPKVSGQWTLDLSNLTIPEGASRKFFVKASTKQSQKIPDEDHGGLAPTDPYYPAVMDWLQEYEEGDIHLAHFYGMDNKPVQKGGEDVLLSLKEMYWLDIPPVSLAGTDDWEWILKAGMGGSSDKGASVVAPPVERIVDGVAVTTVHVTVSMMISNRADSVAYPPRPPCTLRGLEPGSTSSNSNAGVWNSANFKVQGMLQNGLVDNIWRSIRWFTFGPNSFGAADSAYPFSRTIELPAPADVGYDWAAFPDSTILYRFSIDEALGPMTIYELNDQSAELYHTSSP